jgi:hypothetical protein
MALKLNDTVYAHSDGTLVVTPREGANAAIPFELKHVKGFEWDPGASSTTIDGFQVGPDGIAPTAAKPKWSAELSAVGEVLALTKHLGAGAVTIPCDVVLTFQRKGKPTTKIEIVETLITDGLGGGKSDSGSAPNGKIGGNCVDQLIDGVSILNRPRE